MFKKSIFTLLSAVTLAGAFAPTVSTFASSQDSTPVAESVVKDDNQSVLISDTDSITNDEITTSIETESDPAVIAEATAMLAFLFEEVGEVNKDGDYVITNIELLEQTALEDSELGRIAADILKNVVDSRERALNEKYVICVVLNTLDYGAAADIMEFVTGDMVSRISSWITKKAWSDIAKYLERKLVELGLGAAGVSVPGMIARCAVAVVTC